MIKKSSNVQRKLALDYLKFSCIIIIIIHHSFLLENRLFYGYILVELFFMISGYLLISKCQKYENIEILPMMKKRINRVYPEYFFAWLLILAVSFMGYRSFPYPSKFNMIAEMLLIQNWYKIGGINYPAWYISVMVLAEIVILLLYKFTDRKKFIISSSLLIALIYGSLIYFSPNQIEVWDVRAYIFYVPFWRGLADMLLGGLIYYISDYLQGKIRGIFINVTYFGLIGTLITLLFTQSINDYILVAIIWMIVLLSTLDDNVLNKCHTGRFHRFITEYQYGIYLHHACMFLLFGKVKKYCPNTMTSVLVLLVGTIAGAVLYTQFQRLIINSLKKRDLESKYYSRNLEMSYNR